jgi:hypothetical protein
MYRNQDFDTALCVDSSVGGLLVPEGNIHPVVSVYITESIPLLVDY